MADRKLLERTDVVGLERVVPEVSTLARPEPGPLLAARHEIARNTGIREIFSQARREKWPTDKLVYHLTPELGLKLIGTPEQIDSVARYLADEYEQIGDAVLVCSSVTGKAFARISDEDFIQPAPRPRDDGRMITPPKELRPDLHGFLVQWVFDEEREKRITEALALRIHQTELQKQEGDPRLLPLTRAGRSMLVNTLREALPTLLRASLGPGRAFLDRFAILDEPPKDAELSLIEKRFACYFVESSLADPTTFNLKYDRLQAMFAQVRAGWVRDFALNLAIEAQTHAAVQVTLQWNPAEPMHDVLNLPQDLWVCDPCFMKYFGFAECQEAIPFPVAGSPFVGLQGKVGAIVPKSYRCESREVFDRWETAAEVKYELYVDWHRIAHVDWLGLPLREVQAEVVR